MRLAPRMKDVATIASCARTRANDFGEHGHVGMTADGRRNAPTRSRARVVRGRQLRSVACTMIGISETGARLIFRVKKDVPDLFAIDMPGHVRRKCRVIWRGEKDIGMAFEPVRVRRPRKSFKRKAEGGRSSGRRDRCRDTSKPKRDRRVTLQPASISTNRPRRSKRQLATLNSGC